MTQPRLHGFVAALFLTAAALAQQPVHFTVANDNRGSAGFPGILEQVKKSPGGPGLFMLTAGDIDPPQATRAGMDQVFGPDFVWYPVIGNHEAETPEDMDYCRKYYAQHHKGKVNPGPPGCEETTYSFDAGPVHVAVINQYWNGTTEPAADTKVDGDVVPALLAWLKKDLAASTKPWKIVIAHEPAYPMYDMHHFTARHLGDSLDKYPANRDAFWKTMEQAGCVAFICGHTHRYSRFHPDKSPVWQIDTAQARSDKDWKYDTFIAVDASDTQIEFKAYRNLETQGQFKVVDSFSVTADEQNKAKEAAVKAAAPKKKAPSKKTENK